MKKVIFTIFLSVLFVFAGIAQSHLTPYKWSYSAKKIAGNTYEFIL